MNPIPCTDHWGSGVGGMPSECSPFTVWTLGHVVRRREATLNMRSSLFRAYRSHGPRVVSFTCGQFTGGQLLSLVSVTYGQFTCGQLYLWLPLPVVTFTSGSPLPELWLPLPVVTFTCDNLYLWLPLPVLTLPVLTFPSGYHLPVATLYMCLPLHVLTFTCGYLFSWLHFSVVSLSCTFIRVQDMSSRVFVAIVKGITVASMQTRVCQ